MFAGFAQRHDEEGGSLASPPAGEGQPPAGFKGLPQVGEGSRRIGEEHDAEPGRHEIGALGLEIVDGGVGEFEPDGRLRGARSRARASIGSEMSSPSTSPPGLTRAAKSIVVAPQPAAESMTRSPGLGFAAAISRWRPGAAPDPDVPDGRSIRPSDPLQYSAWAASSAWTGAADMKLPLSAQAGEASGLPFSTT